MSVIKSGANGIRTTAIAIEICATTMKGRRRPKGVQMRSLSQLTNGPQMIVTKTSIESRKVIAAGLSMNFFIA